MCALHAACGLTESNAPAAGSGSGGLSAGNAGSGRGGAADPPASTATPPVSGSGGNHGGSAGTSASPVDPEVSRDWTFEACGRIPSGRARRVDAKLGSYAPDGKTLAVAWNDGAVRLYGWPLTEAPPRVLPSAPEPSPISVAFSPDGSLLVQAGTGLVVRRVADGAVVARFALPDEPCPISKLALSQDNAHLLTQGGGNACVFRIHDGALLSRLSARSAAFRGSEVVAVGCSATASELCVSTLSGAEVGRVSLAGAPIAREAFSVAPGGESVAGYRGEEGERTLLPASWSTQDGSLHWTGTGSERDSHVPPPTYSEDARLALFSGLGVYRTSDGAQLHGVDPRAPIWDAQGVLAPDGSTLLTSDAVLVQLESGAQLGVLRNHHSDTPVVSLDISSSGELLATNAMDVLGWRVAENFADSRPIWRSGAEGAFNVDVAPDGTKVALSGDVRLVIDARDGRELWTDRRPIPDSVACIGTELRFSPDGAFMAGKRYGTLLELFDTRMFEPISAVETGGCGQGVAFAPEGQRLHTPELSWLIGQTPQRELDSADDDPLLQRFIEVSPDGSTLVDTRCDSSPGCRSSLRGQPGAFRGMTARHPRFSNEGHWVVAGGTLLHLPSGETRVYDEQASEALFAPNGDIIAGLNDASLVRYCRRAP